VAKSAFSWIKSAQNETVSFSFAAGLLNSRVMQKIKCARQDERMPFRTGFNSSPVTRHSSLFSLLGLEKVFLEKRTQTMPVIIDDREKTNPKRTQIKP
jgi:hypothetical protein